MNHHLHVRRMGVDTYRQPVAYLRADCPVCRAEGFEARTRVRIVGGERSIEATLNVVTSLPLGADEVGLSDEAFHALGLPEGAKVRVAHPPPLESFAHVRAKIYGARLDAPALDAIVHDIASGRYSELHTAAFVTACAAARLDRDEVIALTRAMVRTGSRLTWFAPRVVDKHCVGGLPGNRTTPIVVAIAAAHGLVIPKTSSRAITSPAGTADVVDTFTRATLSLEQMRRVVEREGGCLAWGGAMALSPVDDLLIRVEQPLDIDSEGQLVASVVSKKVAAGSTDTIIDIPVGPTAKVRTIEAADRLGADLVAVGEAVGLRVRVVVTDGRAPVGRGLGPALEGRDVLAVLQNAPDAPADLRERAVTLAGAVLELDGKVADGAGAAHAHALLESGAAWRKFAAICEAQGGLWEPPTAPYTAPVHAVRAGRVVAIDNRRLARAAKLAGAPTAPSAGLVLHKNLGAYVEAGEPLFTLHAEASGELDYARGYVGTHPEMIQVEEG